MEQDRWRRVAAMFSFCCVVSYLVISSSREWTKAWRWPPDRKFSLVGVGTNRRGTIDADSVDTTPLRLSVDEASRKLGATKYGRSAAAYKQCRQSLESFLEDAKHGKALSADRLSKLRLLVESQLIGFVVPLLILTTRETLCLTDNFYTHADRLQPSNLRTISVARNVFNAERLRPSGFGPNVTYIINACVDTESYHSCKALKPGPNGFAKIICMDMRKLAPITAEFSKDDPECYYHMLMWTKVVLLQAVASLAVYGVLLIDTDVFLRERLHEWARARMKPEASIMMGGEPDGSANTGTVYATSKSAGLIRAWLEEAGGVEEMRTQTADQGALARLFHKHPNYWEQVQLITPFLLRQCGLWAKVATHFNCHFNGTKAQRMFKKKVWAPQTEACTLLGNS